MSMIRNKYLNSVVCIGTLTKNKEKYDSNQKDGDKKLEAEISWIGTGFLVYKATNRKEKRGILYLVTCRHVAKSQGPLFILMKNKDTLKYEPILLNSDDLIFHDDEKVDVAVYVLNVNDINNKNLIFEGFDIDLDAMTTNELINEGVGQGNLLYMLGFPLNLSNCDNNPICRLGCISRMEENEIKSLKSYLIDIQGFPGESGSPIIIRPDANGLGKSKIFDKSILIGMISSYIPYQHALKDLQTNSIVEIREENSGIAKIVPIEFIREIIENTLKNE